MHKEQYPGKSFPLDQVAIRLVDLPPLMSRERLDTPEKVAQFMAETLRDYDREVFCVVNVRPDLKPINLNFVSMGSLTESMVHPREVLKSSILSNASGVLLIHNHTTGEVNPSKADIEVTDRLAKACDLMGIPVIDHLIVGPTENYYSFVEKGTLTFERNHYANTIEEIEMEGMRVQEQKNTFDPRKAAEDRKKEMEEMSKKLEEGVKGVFKSGEYKKYLDFCSKLPRYSLNNQILIMLQKPDATLCQSFGAWKEMNRFVKKGEKGIRILAHAPYKIEKEQDKVDASGNVMRDKDGEPIKEKVEIKVNAFKPVSTFDISQTDGDPIPKLGLEELTGSVDGYGEFINAIKEAVPVPVEFEQIESGAKGYFDPEKNRIAVKEGMSETQTVKTLLHEAAHQALHSREAFEKNPEKKSKNQKETEAESVAYVVCQHYGIDTSDYSFAYVATWSADKELPELRGSLETIRRAASDLIGKIDERLAERNQERTDFVSIDAYMAEHGEELPFDDPAVDPTKGFIRIEPPVDLSDLDTSKKFMITAESVGEPSEKNQKDAKDTSKTSETKKEKPSIMEKLKKEKAKSEQTKQDKEKQTTKKQSKSLQQAM